MLSNSTHKSPGLHTSPLSPLHKCTVLHENCKLHKPGMTRIEGGSASAMVGNSAKNADQHGLARSRCLPVSQRAAGNRDEVGLSPSPPCCRFGSLQFTSNSYQHH